jgi:hypothetical protein
MSSLQSKPAAGSLLYRTANGCATNRPRIPGGGCFRRRRQAAIVATISRKTPEEIAEIDLTL